MMSPSQHENSDRHEQPCQRDIVGGLTVNNAANARTKPHDRVTSIFNIETAQIGAGVAAAQRLD